MEIGQLVAVSNNNKVWELARFVFKASKGAKTYSNKYYCKSLDNEFHYWVHARADFTYDGNTGEIDVQQIYFPFDKETILPYKDNWLKGIFFGEKGLGKICTVGEKGVIILGVNKFLSYTDMFKYYTFEDGSICGVTKG